MLNFCLTLTEEISGLSALFLKKYIQIQKKNVHPFNHVEKKN